MSTSIATLPIRATRFLHAWALLGLIALASPAAATPGAPGAPPAAVPRAAPGPAAAGVVNLNTASEGELLRLPGVGPSKAAAILALRTQMKGFKRLEDLMRVKGIGRKTFRELQPMLTLEGPTTLVERRASKSNG
jgi:competence protein ComEA